ncbi:ATP-binding protein [Halapricum salinum]|uniref:ATP-binding protein n=1 Tax=Halapricum salinum TaxID=1457250 RepID=A0A4D6H9N4_9EURY|nr:ATP-binding protein [Halapricum salinum]QCC49916.1 ATP-binding protein [Halapricum salinum]
MHKTPQVNEVNEFIEIASDFEDPLEVIREALSNSYDAGATQVDIKIEQDAEGRNTLIIKDDGHGMDEDDLSSFFDLGNSNKDDAIGYKGHGTKIYYKSDKIRVETVTDGTRIESVMDQPWAKLNDRELPTYSIEETESDEPSRTRIEVHGFRAGQGFDPRKLTYNKIEHYIKWKTIGGSTAWHFGDDFHEMDINVELSPTIDDTQDQIETDNRLQFPPENRDPEGEFVAEEMCKHYPPRELTVTLDDSRELTIEVVGMVGGKEARNKLPTYGKHSAQFGIWLAKDHIKVERYNDAIGADNEFFHFFFIANCQDLELSANREKIRNKSGDVYQSITDELNRYMTKVCQDSWYRNYIERRKLENKQRSIQSQGSSLEERLQHTKDQGGLSPSNPAEVIAALERYSANGSPETLEIADFRLDEEVNAIVDTDEGYKNAALQVKLSDFFENETPLTHIDRFICWKLGDLDALTKIERSSYLGKPIRFDFSNNEVTYGDENKKTIPVLELADKV